MKMKKLLILLAALLMLAIVISMILARSGVKGVEPAVTGAATAAATATPRLKLEVDPNAGERITPTPAPTMPGVAIPGWGSLTLPAGMTEADVSLMNPAANAGWYDLTFELRLKDSGEVIFSTGLVPAGKYLNHVTLTRPMEKGQYEAILHVQPYTANEAQTPTNNADMETLLIVQ